ncbi:hypothetical protein Nstercoris_02007 [Nitrosomonas stercoris]|uniref:Potassium channel domain-containing protein n=1 Tax=Nitrosomonas stercoris TaxID=1444684 RepID=A0A4Y1YNI8_9PROT|nr:hypothetical protein Nstercoris_02007 [Nitrosomonas stercoris]
MGENKSEPLISRTRFLLRLLWHIFLAFIIIFATLAVGVIGHLLWGDENLHDALLNSAFVMGGLGVIQMPDSTTGKLFYAFYGIFVELSFAASIGIVLAPIAHRILHTLHLDSID